MKKIVRLPKPSDAELICLAMNGDDKALTLLFGRIKSTINISVHYILNNKMLEEDASQDTYEELTNLIRKHKYEEKMRFKSFVKRIARSKAVDVWNDEKHVYDLRMKQDESAMIDYLSPERMLIFKQRAEEVDRWLSYLPDFKRLIVRMHYLLELSAKEIAVRLKMQANYVRSILSKAKKLLQDIRSGKKRIHIRKKK